MPGRTEGTNTIHFIGKNEVPKDGMRDVTYASIVCTERPQKAEKERTRLVGGGNLINNTTDLLTAKLLLNSIISTPGAKMACFDVKNFYLNTPMERYEYLRMHIDDPRACMTVGLTPRQGKHPPQVAQSRKHFPSPGRNN